MGVLASAFTLSLSLAYSMLLHDAIAIVTITIFIHYTRVTVTHMLARCRDLQSFESFVYHYQKVYQSRRVLCGAGAFFVAVGNCFCL